MRGVERLKEGLVGLNVDVPPWFCVTGVCICQNLKSHCIYMYSNSTT